METPPKNVVCAALDVIQYYTNNGFLVMHDLLRGREIEYTKNNDNFYNNKYSNNIKLNTNNLKDIIVCLNKFIWQSSQIFKQRQLTDELCRVNPRIILYRGTSDIDLPLTIGSIINSTKRQFLSFTTNYQIALTFKTVYILKLLVNSRSDVYLPISNIKYNSKQISPHNEDEFLLPIETSLIVVGEPYSFSGTIILPVRIHRQKLVNSFKVYTKEELENVVKI